MINRDLDSSQYAEELLSWATPHFVFSGNQERDLDFAAEFLELSGLIDMVNLGRFEESEVNKLIAIMSNVVGYSEDIFSIGYEKLDRTFIDNWKVKSKLALKRFSASSVYEELKNRRVIVRESSLIKPTYDLSGNSGIGFKLFLTSEMFILMSGFSDLKCFVEVISKLTEQSEQSGMTEYLNFVNGVIACQYNPKIDRSDSFIEEEFSFKIGCVQWILSREQLLTLLNDCYEMLGNEVSINQKLKEIIMAKDYD